MGCRHRELENMAHGGRPLPSNPALARPPILWAEDFVAIAGSLPLMDPQGGLKPLPESGPYVQPVSFQGATALHLATFYGHLGVTDLLLAAGACDVTARNIQVQLLQLIRRKSLLGSVTEFWSVHVRTHCVGEWGAACMVL